MNWIECNDIFNAVYSFVRASYITNWFSTKTKTRSVSENISEDESLSMTKTEEPQGQTNENTKEITGTNSETVSESVERADESDVMDKIRLDIEEKFPYLMASVCSNLAQLDRDYRKLKGYRSQPTFSEFMIESTDEFPLSERFVFSAIMYISSMVLMDVDEKKSDEYYDKYACSVSKIISEMPFEQGKTVEKYPY